MELTRQATEARTPKAQIHLHPNAAALYAAKVADLETALNAPDCRTEAAGILRGLIDRVVLTPDPAAPDGLAAVLHGDLPMILSLAASAEAGGSGGAGKVLRTGNKKRSGTFVPGRELSVVAGRRCNLCRISLRWHARQGGRSVTPSV